MEKTCKEIVEFFNAASPQVQILLTSAFVMFALYFSVSFGESLGKAFFYMTH